MWWSVCVVCVSFWQGILRLILGGRKSNLLTIWTPPPLSFPPRPSVGVSLFFFVAGEKGDAADVKTRGTTDTHQRNFKDDLSQGTNCPWNERVDQTGAPPFDVSVINKSGRDWINLTNPVMNNKVIKFRWEDDDDFDAVSNSLPVARRRRLCSVTDSRLRLHKRLPQSRGDFLATPFVCYHPVSSGWLDPISGYSPPLLHE